MAAVAFILPIAGADELEGRSLWRPSTWTGVVTGAPVPGEGLPPAAVPAHPVPLPEGMDSTPEYEGQLQCDPTPKPGAQALADLIKNTYGATQTVWIPRACDRGGRSEHKEGRALDWMTNVRDAQGRANAETFLNWLLGVDHLGRPYGNAMRLGVMYIGWNDRIWRGYEVERGWTELKGCFNRTERSADTVCHRDHIHISLTWDGASGRTSFWTGVPSDVPFCPRARSTAQTPDPVVRGQLVAIAPVRVLNTATATGIGQRCRLQQDRWAGDNRRIFPRVLGVGEVPASGVSGVSIQVTAVNTNAPTQVRVWAPGQKQSQVVLRAPINGTSSGQTIVPVAADGTIAIAMQYGAADVVVDVLGYYGLNGDPVAIPAPLEVAPPALDAPPESPAAEPEFPASDDGFVAVGTAMGYASAAAEGPLRAKEVRTVTLAGLPAEATTALVAVTTSNAKRKGSITLGPADGAPAANVRVRKGRETTAIVMLPVSGGAINLTNTKRPDVNVQVQVLGFTTNGNAPTAVGRAPAPLFKGKAAAGEARVIKAAGQLGLPKRKKLKAVLFRVTTRGKTEGHVTITAQGAESTPTATLPMLAKQRSTHWLLVPTNDTGHITVSTTVRGKVRGDVAGFVR